MYEAYWKLKSRPFENTASPEFFYPSQSAQGALLKVRYAVENQRSVGLLTGPSGLGKSLLTKMLLNQLPDQFFPKLHLVFPQLNPEQLLGTIASQLGYSNGNASWPGVGESINWLTNQLAENTRQGKHAVIAIDEAHLLDEYGSLETLRLLTNLETDGRLDLTLLLVGQTELLPAIDRMPSLEERLGVKCLLRSLDLDETIAYVNHRLSVAGATSEIFIQDALEKLYEVTDGVPRRINRLCDLAMLIGFAEEDSLITPDQIEAVHGELVSLIPE